MPRCNNKLQVMALVVLAGGAAAPARGEIIYSNFGTPQFGGNGRVISSVRNIAASFQAGNTARFTSADLALQSNAQFPQSLNVFLARDAGGTPGAILDTLSSPGLVPLSPSIVNFTSTTTPTLTAGEKYWIVTTFGSGQVAWRDNTLGLGGVAFQENNGPWQLQRFLAPAFQVNGDPVAVAAVPEPTSLALFLTGGVGFLVAARRRRQFRQA